MTTIALNKDYDIYLDSINNLAFLNDVNEVEQNITNILRLWLAEADFDTTRGVLYRSILGETGSSLNSSFVKSEFTRNILLANGVADVLKLDYTINHITNNLVVSAIIKLNNNTILPLTLDLDNLINL